MTMKAATGFEDTLAFARTFGTGGFSEEDLSHLRSYCEMNLRQDVRTATLATEHRIALSDLMAREIAASVPTDPDYHEMRAIRQRVEVAFERFLTSYAAEAVQRTAAALDAFFPEP